jgi:NIPSNAP
MRINCWKFKGGKSNGWTVCAVALLSFAAGSLVTARLAHTNQVKADSNRVFDLRVYHTVPAKVSALESRFRDTTSKLLAKHDLYVVGYWVPEGAPAWDNTFIFLVAHSSREEAKKNWGAMMADPRVSRGDQIRAGQQTGGKNGPDVHAADGLFAHEVVPDLARFGLGGLWQPMQSAARLW